MECRFPMGEYDTFILPIHWRPCVNYKVCIYINKIQRQVHVSTFCQIILFEPNRQRIIVHSMLN